MPTIGAIAFTSIVKLIMLSVNLFAFAILIRVVLSWVAPGMHNPATAIIATLSEPVLRPLRRILPPMGGFDLSPMLAIIGLFALNIVIRGYSPLGL
jgi:YggT family protein